MKSADIKNWFKNLQHKPYYIGLIVVFLVSLAVGKYTQSNALTSSSVVYATTVKDKKTGKNIRYQVQRVGKSRYKLTNATTGKTYTGTIQTEADKSLSIPLPEGKGARLKLKNTGQLTPRPILIVIGTERFVQVGKTSVTSAPVASRSTANQATSNKSSAKSSSTSSKPSSGDKSSTPKTSSDEKNKSSDKSSTSNKPDSNSKTDSNNSQDLTAGLSYEQMTAVQNGLAQWLSEDKAFGNKESVVVKTTPGEPSYSLYNRGGDLLLGSVSTPDGDVLTSVSGLVNGDSLDSVAVSSAYLNGQETDKDGFIKELRSFKTSILGVKPSSSSADDLTKGLAIRLYTLKDKEAHTYDSFSDELEAIEKAIPSDVDGSVTSKAGHYGFDYYFDNNVDSSKSSYQFIPASNGKVYMVEHYAQSNQEDGYKEAPKAVQDKYQELLKKAKDGKMAESSKTSEKSPSSSSSLSSSQASSSNKAGSASWSSSKAEQLRQFMASWGNQMSQHYEEFTPSSTGNYFGLTVPTSSMNADSPMPPAFDEQVVTLDWSEDGISQGDHYALVAAYSDIDDKDNIDKSGMDRHLYYFTIKNGVPQVWITQQNQGGGDGHLHFKETANEDLKNGFVSIVGQVG